MKTIPNITTLQALVRLDAHRFLRMFMPTIQYVRESVEAIDTAAKIRFHEIATEWLHQRRLDNFICEAITELNLHVPRAMRTLKMHFIIEAQITPLENELCMFSVELSDENGAIINFEPDEEIRNRLREKLSPKKSL